jgi:nucleotide-binding universal stress UspA family protein
VFDRILVPLDGSRLSIKAIPHAAEIAEKFGSEVILLQVVKQTTPLTFAEPAGMTSPGTTQVAIQAAEIQDRENIAGARRYLGRQVKKFTDKGIKASYQVIMGNPPDTIISFSHKKKIGLVVMTTHGRSGIKRAIAWRMPLSVIPECL